MSPQPQGEPAEPGSIRTPAAPSGDPDALDPFLQLLRRYNHRCRNSLSGIKMGLYLLEREAALPAAEHYSELSLIYEDIERLFDRLQMIYRTCSLTWVRSPLGQLIAERLPSWRNWFSARGQSLQIDPPLRDDPGDFDPTYLGTGLDAFAAWRAAACDRHRQPRLSWRIHAGSFEVCWDERAHSSEACVQELDNDCSRQREDSESSDSLAMILLGKVVSAHRGQVETTSGPPFGAKLHWPQICSRESAS
jgi:hypothetical protein